MEDSNPINLNLSETASDMLHKYAVTGDEETLSKFLDLARDPTILAFLVEHARIECKERGDCPAFNILWRYYQNPIFKYLYDLVGNREIGHELVQETFLQAWLKLPSAKEETKRKFKSWLYTIAHNLAMDYFRHPQPSIQPLNDIDFDSTIEPSSSNELEESICERDLIKNSLSRMKSRYREILLIEVFQNRSQREKAESLGLTESAFSSYVRRARNEFKEIYEHLSKEAEQES
jgi:RNA polymerase sigma-70 factor, ECF subfamily